MKPARIGSTSVTQLDADELERIDKFELDQGIRNWQKATDSRPEA